MILRLLLALAGWCWLSAGAWAQDSVPEAADAASAPQATERVRRPPLVWTLDIQAPGSLDTLLSTYLDLARYHDDPSLSQGADGRSSITRSELRRLVAAAPDQARSLLEARGYFSAQIQTSVSDEVAGQPVVIRLVVEPGPRTRVSRVQMVFEGDLDNALSKDDAFAKNLVADLESTWALPAGDVFTQDDWSAAKNGMLARMRAHGYPLASWSGAAATVDAQQQTAALFVVADSGPVFHFGDVYIEGLKVQPASAVLNLAPFSKGQVYREQALLDFQERIQKLNLFDSVFVAMEPDQASADAAPVTVQVRELPLQQATLGAGVSSDTGPRVSAEHLHRHVLGYDWQAKTKLQLGKADSSLQVDLTSHPLAGRKHWLASMQLARQLDSSQSVTTSERLRFGQSQEGERLERTRYVEYQSAAVNAESGEKVSEASAICGQPDLAHHRHHGPGLAQRGPQFRHHRQLRFFWPHLWPFDLVPAFALGMGFDHPPGSWPGAVQPERQRARSLAVPRRRRRVGAWLRLPVFGGGARWRRGGRTGHGHGQRRVGAPLPEKIPQHPGRRVF
jgi:translocation and assembly module TamA